MPTLKEIAIGSAFVAGLYGAYHLGSSQVQVDNGSLYVKVEGGQNQNGKPISVVNTPIRYGNIWNAPTRGTYNATRVVTHPDGTRDEFEIKGDAGNLEQRVEGEGSGSSSGSSNGGSSRGILGTLRDYIGNPIAMLKGSRKGPKAESGNEMALVYDDGTSAHNVYADPRHAEEISQYVSNGLSIYGEHRRTGDEYDAFLANHTSQKGPYRVIGLEQAKALLADAQNSPTTPY